MKNVLTGLYLGQPILLTSLLELTSDADAIAQQIRSLTRLYGKQQQFDRLFCTSAALVAMSRSIPQEQGW